MTEFAHHCASCPAPVAGEAYFTEVNPPGGYGNPQVLVCDACLMSDDWADYRKRRGIVAPANPITAWPNV